MPFVEPFRTRLGVIFKPSMSKANSIAQQANALDDDKHQATTECYANDVGGQETSLPARVEKRIC